MQESDEPHAVIFLDAVNLKSETLVDFDIKVRRRAHVPVACLQLTCSWLLRQVSPEHNEHVCLAAARGRQAPFRPKESSGGRGYRSLLGEAALRRIGRVRHSTSSGPLRYTDADAVNDLAQASHQLPNFLGRSR